MGTISNLQDRLTKAFAPPAPQGQEELPPEFVLSPADASRPADRGTALHRLGSHLRSLYGNRSHLSGAHRAVAQAEAAARSRQIATVVHEIRTPLNGILGMTHLLGQTGLTAEQQNYLSSIRQSGHMLAQLVDDMLDLSTMEAGRFRLNNRAANLRQLIESVVEMLAPRAHEKRIEIAATFSADLPELLDFDPARLRQVLFNIIGNAVKFTEAGGVLVRVRVEKDTVRIAVADTGPGMTATDMTRIAGEFEQAGSAETRSGGTGLGLGIASRILAEFAGSLSVRSVQGGGSTFIIRFPLRLAEDAAAGDVDRSGLLQNSRVLLLAPQGPSAAATLASIEALGGFCRHLSSPSDGQIWVNAAVTNGAPFTDLIVDHRFASQDGVQSPSHPLHRVLLVNPEERASQPQELFDAWLIRPLREKSLIDVLSGNLRGLGSNATDAPSASPTEDNLNGVVGTGLSVLLAEDDPVSATIVKAVLQKAGHSVQWVADVQAMAQALADPARRHDLVISDINMPGGRPLDLLSSRAAGALNEGFDDQPVILILSGDGSDAAIQSACDAGAAKVLRKPAEPAQLLQAVRAVMAESGRHTRVVDVSSASP